MSDLLLTKRLHISGLTPSISPADLECRLSSFGKVKAMDDFGARDALGDPRKFGFVTMEIGAKELAKCLNVLSGSTWKGAKLRIGEAKPDFREQLAQFNSQPARPVRLKRARTRNLGYLSTTLPLTPLSASAAASTPGWVVTPSGRVVRPMRMRPERPLEPIRSELGTSKVKGMNGKVTKRVKPTPIRARRRLIDPTKWNSTYLKGVFLDAISVPLSSPIDSLEPAHMEHDIMDQEDEEEMDEVEPNNNPSSSAFGHEVGLSKPDLQDHALATPTFTPTQEAAVVASSRMHGSIDSINVREEANTALAMLDIMFGDEEWDGRESVDEMQGIEVNEAMETELQGHDNNDIEIVPRKLGIELGKIAKKDKGKGKEESTRQDTTVRDGEVEVVEISPPVAVDGPVRTTEFAPRTDLKALFAPREEVSFSLLDHLELDLDLELDADILGLGAPSSAARENDHPPRSTLPASQMTQTPHVAQFSSLTTKVHSRMTLDPSHPPLFPPLDSLPHPHTPYSNLTIKNRPGALPCLLFPSTTHLWNSRTLPPSITFTRSSQDSSESIRERWEEDKTSLTQQWKKAWREARGSKRGGAGSGGDVGSGY